VVFSNRWNQVKNVLLFTRASVYFVSHFCSGTLLQILCSAIAVVLHYLFLTAFAWMSIEGIQLYVMLVEVFEAEKSRVKWYYTAAYGTLLDYFYNNSIFFEKLQRSY